MKSVQPEHMGQHNLRCLFRRGKFSQGNEMHHFRSMSPVDYLGPQLGGTNRWFGGQPTGTGRLTLARLTHSSTAQETAPTTHEGGRIVSKVELGVELTSNRQDGASGLTFLDLGR